MPWLRVLNFPRNQNQNQNTRPLLLFVKLQYKRKMTQSAESLPFKPVKKARNKIGDWFLQSPAKICAKFRDSANFEAIRKP